VGAAGCRASQSRQQCQARGGIARPCTHADRERVAAASVQPPRFSRPGWPRVVCPPPPEKRACRRRRAPGRGRLMPPPWPPSWARSSGAGAAPPPRMMPAHRPRTRPAAARAPGGRVVSVRAPLPHIAPCWDAGPSPGHACRPATCGAACAAAACCCAHLGLEVLGHGVQHVLARVQ
jgi:hypothetical protein